MLNKNDFFTHKTVTKKVPVPALNGEVTIRELTFGQRNDIHKRAIISPVKGSGIKGEAKADGTILTVWTVIYGVVDKEGNQMFTEADYQKLADIRPYDALDDLSGEIWLLSGSNEATEKNADGV